MRRYTQQHDREMAPSDGGMWVPFQDHFDCIDDLKKAVRHYMLCHDRYGGDDIKTGRAWDAMRKRVAQEATP